MTMEQQGFLFSDVEPTPEQPTPEQPTPEPTAKRAEKPARPTPPQPAQRVSVDGQVEQLVTLRVYGEDVTIGWVRKADDRWAAVYVNPRTQRQHKITDTYRTVGGASKAVYDQGIKVEKKWRTQQSAADDSA